MQWKRWRRLIRYRYHEWEWVWIDWYINHCWCLFSKWILLTLSWRHESLCQCHRIGFQVYVLVCILINCRTSSFHIHEDNRDKFINYFNWLVVIYLIMKKWLQEYLLILKSKEIMYKTLLDISTMLWKKWDMIDEVIIMIKKYIIKWNHEWVKGYTWVIIDEFKDIIIT